MIRTAALLVLLAGLALIGLVDHDGRIGGGDLVARAMGYTVRIDVSIGRSAHLPAPPPPGNRWDDCALTSDSLPVVPVWR